MNKLLKIGQLFTSNRLQSTIMTRVLSLLPKLSKIDLKEARHIIVSLPDDEENEKDDEENEKDDVFEIIILDKNKKLIFKDTI